MLGINQNGILPLYDNKVKDEFSQSKIHQNVAQYLASDIGQMELEQLATSDAFKQKHSAIKDDTNALKAKAIEELRGEQYMLNVLASNNNNGIRGAQSLTTLLLFLKMGSR